MKTILTTFLLFPVVIFSQFSIGHYTITFQDSERSNRSIETEVYYPANISGESVAPANGIFPVIVFGHGFAMSTDAYQNIWEDLVPKGFILAFPTTEGSMFSTDHQEFGWDLEFLIHQFQFENLNSSSLLFQHIAPSSALMGHSMGGGACFLAADSLNASNFNAFKGLIGLAPAESTSNGVSSIHSAKFITSPSLIFSGTNDGVTPPSDHHIPMYDSLASTCKTIVHINGGGHCYFANYNFNCSFGESTSSSGISLTREEQQTITTNILLPWLNYTLYKDCNKFQAFQDSLNNSNQISYNQFCNSPATLDAEAQVVGNSIQANQSNANYQWLDCQSSNNIQGAVNQVYYPLDTNEYQVIVSTSNCVDTSSCFAIVSTLGIGTTEQSKIDFKVYPNPTNQDFIRANKSGLITIYSIEGKMVYSTYHFTNQSIDIQNLKTGIYLVEILNNNNKQVTKLIKE